MASAQVITDLKSIYATGPSAATVANSNSASGQIMDFSGNLALCLLKCQEVKTLMAAMLTNIDSGDGIKTTFTNIQATFV
ncbi:MAG: hypothetical protein KGL39_13585 [Patescibacteria group bacterium]|nr:hypothetical protein [Patescibacteria group bacterium]